MTQMGYLKADLDVCSFWIWLLPEALVQNEDNNIVFMCWTISDMNKAVWEMISNVLLAVIFL